MPETWLNTALLFCDVAYRKRDVCSEMFKADNTVKQRGLPTKRALVYILPLKTMH
jgi:hypothetical protein